MLFLYLLFAEFLARVLVPVLGHFQFRIDSSCFCFLKILFWLSFFVDLTAPSGPF